MKNLLKLIFIFITLNVSAQKTDKLIPALYGAAFQNATEVDTGARAVYQRKLAKTNPIIAKKTVAHKLARSCFYVLRDDLEFDVDKAFGYSK